MVKLFSLAIFTWIRSVDDQLSPVTCSLILYLIKSLFLFSEAGKEVPKMCYFLLRYFKALQSERTSDPGGPSCECIYFLWLLITELMSLVHCISGHKALVPQERVIVKKKETLECPVTSCKIIRPLTLMVSHSSSFHNSFARHWERFSCFPRLSVLLPGQRPSVTGNVVKADASKRMLMCNMSALIKLVSTVF